MTPKEKAIELYQEFINYVPADIEYEHKYAKECALIAAEEIKKQLLENLDNDMSTIHAIYWEKVKQEIENL